MTVGKLITALAALAMIGWAGRASLRARHIYGHAPAARAFAAWAVINAVYVAGTWLLGFGLAAQVITAVPVLVLTVTFRRALRPITGPADVLASRHLRKTTAPEEDTKP